MDEFGVPKKINRHVLKAICALHEDGKGHANVNDICAAVLESMRNNVPVRNLQAVVVQSLQNMRDCGVIEAYGSNYFLRNPDASPSVSRKSSYDSEMSKPSESGGVASGSKGALYESSSGADFAESPLRKRQRLSEDSLDRRSGGEMDSGEVDQLKVDMPATFQNTEKSSSFLPNPPTNSQNYFETPLQSLMRTLVSGTLCGNKDQATGSEHDSKIMTTNLNTDDTSSSVPRDEDTKNDELSPMSLHPHI